MSNQPHRRSLCPPDVREANVEFDSRLRRATKNMNGTTWKAIKLIIANLGITGLSAYALFLGAPPLPLVITSVIVLGLLNGMEVSEFLAAYSDVRVARERVQAQHPQQGQDGGDGE